MRKRTNWRAATKRAFEIEDWVADLFRGLGYEATIEGEIGELSVGILVERDGARTPVEVVASRGSSTMAKVRADAERIRSYRGLEPSLARPIIVVLSTLSAEAKAYGIDPRDDGIVRVRAGLDARDRRAQVRRPAQELDPEPRAPIRTALPDAPQVLQLPCRVSGPVDETAGQGATPIKKRPGGAGRGRALRFDLHQARVAKVLANARASGLSLDALAAVAGPLQAAIKAFLRLSAPTDALPAIIEEIEDPGSLQSNLENRRRIYDRHKDAKYLDLITRYEKPEFQILVLTAASSFPKSDIENLWLFLQLAKAEGFLMVYWSDQESVWKLDRRPPLDGGRLPAPVCILLDLGELDALPNGTPSSPAPKAGCGGHYDV